MVTRTIEYEETVEREEDVTLCDDCQREVDPNGTRYVNTDDFDGRFAVDEGESIRARWSGGEILDLCSECRKKLGVEIEDEDTRVLREWWSMEIKANGITRTAESRFQHLWNGLLTTWALFTVAFLVMAAAAAMGGVPAFAWGIMAVMAWVVIASAIAFVAATTHHLKKANKEVFE